MKIALRCRTNERVLIHKPELQAKELKLLDLIESLGQYLNSDDGVIRGKSVTIFAILTVHCTDPSPSNVVSCGGASSHATKGVDWTT
jgi:hypothetical protein